MIRDYKFRRTEWTLRKKRRFNPRILIRILLLLVIGTAGYSAYEWLTSRQSDDGAEDAAQTQDGDSQVIQLQLPPNPETGTTTTRQGR